MGHAISEPVFYIPVRPVLFSYKFSFGTCNFHFSEPESLGFEETKQLHYH